MSSRPISSRFYFVMFAAALAAGAGGAAISACSSSTTANAPGTDGGSDAPADHRVVPFDSGPDNTDSAVPETTAQCKARCYKEHAASKAIYDAVDTCWAASCKAQCIDQTGAPFDAGADASDAAMGLNDGGTPLCSTPESSGIDKPCDDCTEQNCCPSWKGCYNNADCVALQDCFNACP